MKTIRRIARRTLCIQSLVCVLLAEATTLASAGFGQHLKSMKARTSSHLHRGGVGAMNPVRDRSVHPIHGVFDQIRHTVPHVVNHARHMAHAASSAGSSSPSSSYYSQQRSHALAPVPAPAPIPRMIRMSAPGRDMSPAYNFGQSRRQRAKASVSRVTKKISEQSKRAYPRHSSNPTNMRKHQLSNKVKSVRGGVKKKVRSSNLKQKPARVLEHVHRGAAKVSSTVSRAGRAVKKTSIRAHNKMNRFVDEKNIKGRSKEIVDRARNRHPRLNKVVPVVSRTGKKLNQHVKTIGRKTKTKAKRITKHPKSSIRRSSSTKSSSIVGEKSTISKTDPGLNKTVPIVTHAKQKLNQHVNTIESKTETETNDISKNPRPKFRRGWKSSPTVGEKSIIFKTEPAPIIKAMEPPKVDQSLQNRVAKRISTAGLGSMMGPTRKNFGSSQLHLNPHQRQHSRPQSSNSNGNNYGYVSSRLTRHQNVSPNFWPSNYGYPSIHNAYLPPHSRAMKAAVPAYYNYQHVPQTPQTHWNPYYAQHYAMPSSSYEHYHWPSSHSYGSYANYRPPHWLSSAYRQPYYSSTMYPSTRSIAYPSRPNPIKPLREMRRTLAHSLGPKNHVYHTFAEYYADPNNYKSSHSYTRKHSSSSTTLHNNHEAPTHMRSRNAHSSPVENNAYQSNHDFTLDKHSHDLDHEILKAQHQAVAEDHDDRHTTKSFEGVNDEKLHPEIHNPIEQHDDLIDIHHKVKQRRHEDDYDDGDDFDDDDDGDDDDDDDDEEDDVHDHKLGKEKPEHHQHEKIEESHHGSPLSIHMSKELDSKIANVDDKRHDASKKVNTVEQPAITKKAQMKKEPDQPTKVADEPIKGPELTAKTSTDTSA